MAEKWADAEYGNGSGSLFVDIAKMFFTTFWLLILGTFLTIFGLGFGVGLIVGG